MTHEAYVVTGIITDVTPQLEICYDAILPYFQAAPGQKGWLLDTETGGPMAMPQDLLAARNALQAYLLRYALNRLHHRGEHNLGWQRVRVRSHRPAAFKGQWLVELMGADDLWQPINLNDLMLRHRFSLPASV